MTDIDLIAEVAHEANRVLQRREGEVVNFPWENTSEALRASGRAGVQAIIDNPLINPIDLHQQWCDFKVAEGWVFGEVKDFALKTHPCLVPYDQLPFEQRTKDKLFFAVVKALLP